MGHCDRAEGGERPQPEDSRPAAMDSRELETIGRLAGGIAHDFNNMLTAILGNADMAMASLDPESRPYAHVEQIVKAAEGAANLSRQLLAFSRGHAFEPRAVDLNEAVANVRKMVLTLLGETVELCVNPGQRLAAIKADPGHIERVIVDIAVYAKDSMPQGGKLVIETGNAELYGEYRRSAPEAFPGPAVALTISHSGGSVGQDAPERLAMVYDLIRRNGGCLSVGAEAGGRVAFVMRFPAYGGIAAGSGPAMAKERVPGGGETILVVEDNPQVLEFGRASLAKLGYNVITAMSGEEAAAIAKAYDGPIDLLLSDIILPGMNGKETAARIGRDRPRTKVLFDSGYTAEVIDKQGVLEEGVSFIAKPFTSRDLALKVRAVLDGA